MATFVLVHGGWHGGWCWRKVTTLLRGAGHDVHTPTLTGLGERSHLLGPDVTLGTHVHDVANVLEYEDLRDVVLVGHSYAGMVVTGVADRLPERLAHVVYLDAFVPENGQALVDLIPPEARRAYEERARVEGDGWRLPGRSAGPWDVFLRDAYGMTDPDDLRWVSTRLGPHPFATLTEPVQRGCPAAEALPRTYVRCAAYPHVGFDRFAARAETSPGWRRCDLAASHDAMVTAPAQLADLLLELA